MIIDAPRATSSGGASWHDPILDHFDQLIGDPGRTTSSQTAIPTAAWRRGTSGDALFKLLAEPQVVIRFSQQWRNRLKASSDLREDLETSLASVLNGRALTSPDELLRAMAVSANHALLRWSPDGHVIEVDASQAAAGSRSADHLRYGNLEPRPETASAAERPQHARLADELRSLTGLTTRQMAAAMGVTREQYSRWTTGAAISDAKHGQLKYLHTVIRDLVRRLGVDETKIWLQTPVDGATTPADTIIGRRWSELHRLVTELPDEAPVVGNVVVALTMQQDSENDGEEPEEDHSSEDDSWSPYA